AQGAQALERLPFRVRDRAQQGTPGKKHRQRIGEARELGGSILQRQPGEDDVARGASGGVAQVVGDGVGADQKDIGVRPRHAADEGTVTGSEVDVDGREAGGKLRQSSTIYPALLLAFDEVYGRRDYHFQISSTRSAVASR